MTCVEIFRKRASCVKKTEKIYNTAVEATLEVMVGNGNLLFSFI
jgi:hypothetical protein